MSSDLLVTTPAYLIAGIGFCVVGVQIIFQAPRNEPTLEMLVMYFGVLVVLWGLLLTVLRWRNFRRIANAEWSVALKTDK